MSQNCPRRTKSSATSLRFVSSMRNAVAELRCSPCGSMPEGSPGTLFIDDGAGRYPAASWPAPYSLDTVSLTRPRYSTVSHPVLSHTATVLQPDQNGAEQSRIGASRKVSKPACLCGFC